VRTGIFCTVSGQLDHLQLKLDCKHDEICCYCCKFGYCLWLQNPNEIWLYYQSLILQDWFYFLNIFKIDTLSFNKAMTAAIASIFAAGSLSMPAYALSKADILSLSYSQVKGTGLANRCADVTGEGSISLASGKKYTISDLCLEPKSWQVNNINLMFVT
jgi:hypothetical protein